MPANSMKLKEINTELVKSVLKKQDYCTKSSIAKATSLSVATCGNILKELIATGEVLEIDLKPSTGGRPARRFVYNENYAYVAVLYARKEGDYKSLTCVVSNMIGIHVYETYLELEDISIKEFDDAIHMLLKLYPNIKVLGIGIPGVVRQGIIDICDFKKLSGEPLQQHLEKKFNLQVIIENDVNSTAYGFFHRTQYTDAESMVYIYYPIDENPGAGIIVNGQILLGQSNFAGEVSFLPLGVNPKNQSDIQKNKELFADLVAKTIMSINCVINPKSIILSGFCFTEQMIESIKTLLHLLSPKGHLPELIIEDDIHDSYIYGLTSMALTKLSCNIQLIEK
ncbi:ROK family protein [Vallitalea okinawensis]|uniref:ROK family protein n=1 Tax=Vallitalea okinawensis TaxID=2078660 RepID=UPI000CFBE8FD|nr:ROK family protein [Vallitalea okinawensis]